MGRGSLHLPDRRDFDPAARGGTVSDHCAALDLGQRIGAERAIDAALTAWAATRSASEAAETLRKAGIAAAAETCSLVYGFTMGEYVVLPVWIRGLVVLTTWPAMMAGAWVRMQARLATGERATEERA